LQVNYVVQENLKERISLGDLGVYETITLYVGHIAKK